LIETLTQLDQDSLILAPGEVCTYASDGIERLGILKEGRVTSPELLALVRVVRRTKHSHTGNINIPRGPIGEGSRDLTVKAIGLDNSELILVLISDESEAQRVHEVRRDFVANISHELKTPIGALSLLSEAVLSAKNEPESVEKFASRMQHEAKRLTELVQEIINLSRLQDSDPLQVAGEFHINDLVREAVDQCKTTSEAKRITISTNTNGDAVVIGDGDQLIMAIHNLIENAINYSPDNTNVSITTDEKNGIAEISVSDQGIGIAEQELERIFERFYRINKSGSREEGGSGLGLAIVQGIMHAHQGGASVESSVLGGACFICRWPEPTQ
jgi:two-component system sensor histidine kinase SenX3